MATVKVYQAEISSPNKFMDYRFTIQHGGIVRDHYKLVYDGELDAYNPEDVFVILNTCKINGYSGHSLSVSDVIEFNGDIYFVDSFGFKKLESF